MSSRPNPARLLFPIYRFRSNEGAFSNAFLNVSIETRGAANLSMERLSQFGERDNPLGYIPEVGHRIEGDRVGLELIPASPAEVHFRANLDVVTLSLGKTSWVRAYDSDKTHDYTFLPGYMSFQPTDSECHARSDKFEHEMLVLCVDKTLREECLASFSAGKPLSMERARSDLQTNHSLVLAQLARRMQISGHLSNQLAVESMALLLFNEVLVGYNNQEPDAFSKKTLSDHALRKALEYIDESLADNPGLSTIAATVGLSPYHFARAFKAAMGVSTHQYVLDQRLSRSRALLEEKNALLADIAYAVGFSSQAHMTDVFRRKLGITPGKYRREFLK